MQRFTQNRHGNTNGTMGNYVINLKRETTWQIRNYFHMHRFAYDDDDTIVVVDSVC